MKRVFGFALFFVALGMVIMMFIPSIFIGILIVLLCLKKALRMQGFCDTMLTLQKNTCVVYPGGAKADKHGSRT